MYMATTGTFLQRDPLGVPGAPMLGYSDEAVTQLLKAKKQSRQQFGNYPPSAVSDDEHNVRNLYEYVGSNPISRVDPLGLDWLDCMNACMEDNDPAQLALQGLIGLLTIGPVHKLTVAAIAEAVGDSEFAAIMRRGYKLNPKSPLTTWPSALTTKLKNAGALGRGCRVLRSAGRIATPILVAYGNALAAVETHCAGYCTASWWYGVPEYDPATGRILDSLSTYFQ